MFIRLYKDKLRADVMPKVKRVKRKGVLTSKPHERLFNRYEDTQKSLDLYLGAASFEGEHKLEQLPNNFESKVGGFNKHSVTSTIKVNDTEANRNYLIKKEYSFTDILTTLSNGNVVKQLLVNIVTPALNTLINGRASSSLSPYRSYIDIPLKDVTLKDILRSALLLSGKPYTKGHHVLNVKVMLINEGGQALENVLGSASNRITKEGNLRGVGTFNIHEVTVDRVGTKNGKPFIHFSLDTMNRYNGKKFNKLSLLETIEVYAKNEIPTFDVILNELS